MRCLTNAADFLWHGGSSILVASIFRKVISYILEFFSYFFMGFNPISKLIIFGHKTKTIIIKI
jgi:hypothetical protein